MAPCRRNRGRKLTVSRFALLGVLLAALLGLGASNPVWKASPAKEEQGGKTSFIPRQESSRGEALLVWARLAEEAEAYGALKLETIFGSMFGAFDSHRLLGRKPVEWGERRAEVVSFEAKLEDRQVLGRLLITNDGQAPIDALLLLTRSGADPRFEKEFDHLQKRWDHRLPGSANVLYSK